jgi:arginyl-tRNA synthetase
VVVRENGASTYFASDIAYLLNKFERGFDARDLRVRRRPPRLQARAEGRGAAALGLDPARLEIILVQFAVLYEGGEKVQMSTRAGQFVTLRQLRQEVGSDAAPLLLRDAAADEHDLDFDLDLARKQLH